MPILRRWVSLPLALLMATACGSSRTPTAKPTPTPIPQSGSASGGLTALGATERSWNLHHRPDLDFAPGAAYDSDPQLGEDTYTLLLRNRGLITGYTVRLLKGTSLDAAMRRVATELPADAHVVWTRTLGHCVQAYLVSSVLAAAIGPGYGDTAGGVLVQFQSDAATTVDVQSVTSATLNAIPYPTPTDAPPC